MRRQQSRTTAGVAAKACTKKKRATYDQAFKLKVVREALLRPPHNRIKPTCARFPGIEPCQLRKWIRNLEEEARPAASKRAAPKESSAAAAPRAKVETKAKAKPPPPRTADDAEKACPPSPGPSASTRTPRRAAAAARLRVVLCEEEEELDEADSVAEEMCESECGSSVSTSRRASPPLTPQAADPFSVESESRRAARRASSNRTPDKTLDGRCASLAEMKPIFRRAASSKAAQPHRTLSLGARAELPAWSGPEGGGSSWFLPVDGMEPEAWVDEWLSEVASDAASEASAV